MITIKKRNEKWLLGIDETFQFDNTKDLKKILETILTTKEKYGNLENFKERNFKFKEQGE